MSRKPTALLAAFAATALLALTSGMPDTARAGGQHASGCERSAKTMRLACSLDVNDDYFVTLANCEQFSDRDARRECARDARRVRREESGNCRDVLDARLEACELLGEDRYDQDPLLDPFITFIDPDAVPAPYPPNPYVSVAAGHTYVLRAGEEGEETVIVHVTNDSREILGVQCRVVVDVVVEVSDGGDGVEYEPVEVTDDWFAQDDTGNVYYCGEVARNFEDGVLRDLDGSFEAGLDFAKSGVLIRAFPAAGDAHRQEFLLGEAEDIVQYADLHAAPTADEGGDNPLFPCEAPDFCLKTLDQAPIEPESTEFKYYKPGTGFVLAVAMEDGEITGEREELVCVGDSLDILSEPDCQIDDAEGLLEALCKLSPDAFCAD